MSVKDAYVTYEQQHKKYLTFDTMTDMYQQYVYYFAEMIS